MSFAEPMVATVDDPDGLPESAARTLARRFWILGWFGLPLAWATNAYYFWPHLRDARADALQDGAGERIALGGVHSYCGQGEVYQITGSLHPGLVCSPK